MVVLTSDVEPCNSGFHFFQPASVWTDMLFGGMFEVVVVFQPSVTGHFLFTFPVPVWQWQISVFFWISSPADALGKRGRLGPRASRRLVLFPPSDTATTTLSTFFTAATQRNSLGSLSADWKSVTLREANVCVRVCAEVISQMVEQPWLYEAQKERGIH